MFNKEMFGCRKDKIINISTISGVNHIGKVVECSDRFLTLSTKSSSKHHIALDRVESFWCDEDKPAV